MKERQRQSKDRDKDKDGERERETRKRKRTERERESVGRASELWSEFVARRMLSVGPSGSVHCQHTHGSRYVVTTLSTKISGKRVPARRLEPTNYITL